MQYMFLIYAPEDEKNAMPEPGTPAFLSIIQPWAEYDEALKKAGVLVAGEALNPSSTGTCVQHRDGKRVVQDGPFTAAKEQLGGYYIIDVETLDEAIAWAEKCPGAMGDGTIEVRPVMPIPGVTL